MRSPKNKFYRKLKLSKDTRKLIKFMERIKPKMVSSLIKR